MLFIKTKEIETILHLLAEQGLIEIFQHKLDYIHKGNQSEYIEFIILSEKNKTVKKNKNKNGVKKIINSNKMKKPGIIKPKIKKRSVTQKKGRKGFKPPRFKNNIPKTTGMMTKKSQSKITGKKRKLDEISKGNDNDEEKVNEEPNLKRIKYNKTNKNINDNNKENIDWDKSKYTKEENQEMEKLKYEERFLLKEINKLREKSESNTNKNKKDEMCLSYDKLVELTEKWTVATQAIIETIIKENNHNPDATIPKLLQSFGIPPKQVRWNVEDEEFE